MLVYTHLAVGFTIGKVFFPENFFAQVVIWIGAVVPDIPVAGKLFWDVLRKKKPFEEESKIYRISADVSHSLLFWLPSLLISLFFFIGVYSHLFLDVISHKIKDKGTEDPGYLWPIPVDLKKYFGLFNYQIGEPGGLKPSWQEKVIIAVCIVIIVIFW